MSRRIWTQAEVDEAKEQWQHPDIPIHMGEPTSWNRFVFFENVKDAILISIAILGFGCMLYFVIADLVRQHGLIVLGSLIAAVTIVWIFNRK